LFDGRPTFSSSLSGQWVEIALVLLLALSWWTVRMRPFMATPEAYALAVSALLAVPLAEPVAHHLGITNSSVIIAGCVAFVIASLALGKLATHILGEESDTG